MYHWKDNVIFTYEFTSVFKYYFVPFFLLSITIFPLPPPTASPLSPLPLAAVTDPLAAVLHLLRLTAATLSPHRCILQQPASNAAVTGKPVARGCSSKRRRDGWGEERWQMVRCSGKGRGERKKGWINIMIYRDILTLKYHDISSYIPVKLSTQYKLAWPIIGILR